MPGFYIGISVIVMLFVGGWLAWTPLRVWYWERGVRGAATDEERTDCITGLVLVGPSAYPAVKRIYDSLNATDKRGLLAFLQSLPETEWSLPLYVETARGAEITQENFMLVSDAVNGGLGYAGLKGTGQKKDETLVAVLRRDRKVLLDWWEREGRAKYGQ
jgi:hypothetical protein